MEIETHLLRAATKFQAKDDIRYYLNGIHLNHGKIEATNGHIAIILDSGEENDADKIISFIGTIPKKAAKTKLCFNNDFENIAIHYDKNGLKIDAQLFNIIDGRFPKVENVKPKKLKTETFPALQTEYLAIMHKAFEASARNFVAVKPIHYAKGQAVQYELIGAQKEAFKNPVILIQSVRE